jgi:hypothetical protein
MSYKIKCLGEVEDIFKTALGQVTGIQMESSQGQDLRQKKIVTQSLYALFKKSTGSHKQTGKNTHPTWQLQTAPTRRRYKELAKRERVCEELIYQLAAGS